MSSRMTGLCVKKFIALSVIFNLVELENLILPIGNYIYQNVCSVPFFRTVHINRNSEKYYVNPSSNLNILRLREISK